MELIKITERDGRLSINKGGIESMKQIALGAETGDCFSESLTDDLYRYTLQNIKDSARLYMDMFERHAHFYPAYVFSRRKTSNVYVLKNQQGLYKIGKANDVAERMNAIKTMAGDLSFVVAIPVHAEVAFRVERHFHQMFDRKRAYGEWFRLQESDLSAFKEFDYRSFFFCLAIRQRPIPAVTMHEIFGGDIRSQVACAQSELNEIRLKWDEYFAFIAACSPTKNNQ